MAARRHGCGLVRHFRWLVAGYTLSAFGGHLNIVALGLYAFLVTGSALHTGLFMAVRLVSGFVTGLFSGAIVSRFPRKRVMMTADLAQSSALLCLAIVPPDSAAGLLYAVATVAGCGSTLFNVCLRSGIPDIVGAEHRVRGNAMLVTGRSLATVAGMGSAGAIIAVAGFETVFVINAATYLLSALNLARLPLLRTPPEPETSGQPAWKSSLSSAYLVLTATPVLLIMMAVRTVEGFGSASHIVGLPVHAATVQPVEPAMFLSQFWVCWALGNIVAQQIVMRWATRGGRRLPDQSFAVSVIIMSIGFIVVFTGITSWTLMVVALITGIADGYAETSFMSRLQAASEDRRGQLFGLVAMAETTGLGLGMLTSAALLTYQTPSTVVTVMHGLAVVAAIVLLVRLLRRRRARQETELTT
ncbi:putative MFS family arabinose efflux permease [Stackebrandtia endophytica]|uniref:Putative MFS family arabinose efflux permease n=1 Tax=Stackebrandtia endophytica TaxID=1496996 RepID=A0A543B2C0_9ACTN|nr:putative MFS family arabinose efflux permease [Stackebrandtia endophytica]